MRATEQLRWCPAAVAALAILLLSAVLMAGDGPARPKPGSGPAEMAVPFRAGEKLDYRVGWSTFVTAATAQVRVEERRPFYGRVAWHFQAVARTVEPVRYLYALDNQFDSYTDIASLASLQYEIYLREPDKKEDKIVRMSTDGESAEGNGPTTRVPPGTRDPLGAFFSLRAVDWQKDSEARMPVYDGKKLYELRVRRLSTTESVTVPAGTFAATKLELHVYERNRELANTRFFIWLSRDAERMPVLIQAVLPFGELRVELMRR
jgi:hypothetical protein